MSFLKIAYEIGARIAMKEAGLLKEAISLAPAMSYLSSNPYLARAALGAGIGTVVGGASDIGAGRGALAGGLAGAATPLGSRLGKRILGQRVGGEMKAVRDATNRKMMTSPATTRSMKLEEIADRYGIGTPRWQKNLQRAGGMGALGAGTLAGGGALIATQRPEEKKGLAGLFG